MVDLGQQNRMYPTGKPGKRTVFQSSPLQINQSISPMSEQKKLM